MQNVARMVFTRLENPSGDYGVGGGKNESFV